MRFSSFFLLPLSFFVLLWGAFSSISLTRQNAPTQQEVQAELKAIDDQIIELEEKKRGYLSRALRHEDQAERLQYRDHWFLEARRHMELADANREAAAEIQLEIDRLKKRRDQILTQQGSDGFEDL